MPLCRVSFLWHMTFELKFRFCNFTSPSTEMYLNFFYQIQFFSNPAKKKFPKLPNAGYYRHDQLLTGWNLSNFFWYHLIILYGIRVYKEPPILRSSIRNESKGRLKANFLHKVASHNTLFNFLKDTGLKLSSRVHKIYLPTLLDNRFSETKAKSTYADMINLWERFLQSWNFVIFL